MKPLVLASLLLASSAFAVGQQHGYGVAGMEGPINPQAAPSNGQPTVLFLQGNERSCAVGLMHARQGSSPQMEWADDGQKHAIMTPSLELTPKDKRVIVAATVTVRGYTGKGGAMVPATATLVQNDKDTRKEVSRSMTLRFKPSEPGKVLANLSLAGFTVVKTIELNSITYDHGSTWKLAADAGCSVTPDPLLLIGAR